MLSRSRSAPYLLPQHCIRSSYTYFHDVQTIFLTPGRDALWASYILPQHGGRSSYITSCQLKAMLKRVIYEQLLLPSILTWILDKTVISKLMIVIYFMDKELVVIFVNYGDHYDLPISFALFLNQKLKYFCLRFQHLKHLFSRTTSHLNEGRGMTSEYIWQLLLVGGFLCQSRAT